MPLPKGVQNNVSAFNSFVHKMSQIQKNGMHMTEYILIHRNFLYDFALLVLGLLSCSLVSIVKNYTLIIFMLNGSIVLSILEFNLI